MQRHHLYQLFFDVRNTLVRPLVKPARRLGGYLRYGLKGSSAPTGVVNAERYALSQNPVNGSVCVTEAYTAVFSATPVLTETGGDHITHTEADEIPILRQCVSTVENVRIAIRAGSVITSDNLLLCELPLSEPIQRRQLRRKAGQLARNLDAEQVRSLLNSKILNQGMLPRPMKVDGNVAILAGDAHTNFYHWIIDTLPRLRLIEAAAVTIDRYYLQVSGRYNRETLELLGIAEDRCIPATRDQHVQADRAILPSMPPGVATPEICAFLNARLLPAALAKSRAAPKPRLYITRRNALWRRVTNEADVLSLLGIHGFECVALEDYSLADQIQMMHEAEFIVAPHGAGLTGIVFCRPGTRVLELVSPRRDLFYFQRIAACRGLRYLRLVAQQHGAAARSGEDSNIVVHTKQLKAGLEFLENADPLAVGTRPATPIQTDR